MKISRILIVFVLFIAFSCKNDDTVDGSSDKQKLLKNEIVYAKGDVLGEFTRDYNQDKKLVKITEKVSGELRSINEANYINGKIQSIKSTFFINDEETVVTSKVDYSDNKITISNEKTIKEIIFSDDNYVIALKTYKDNLNTTPVNEYICKRDENQNITALERIDSENGYVFKEATYMSNHDGVDSNTAAVVIQELRLYPETEFFKLKYTKQFPLNYTFVYKDNDGETKEYSWNDKMEYDSENYMSIRTVNSLELSVVEKIKYEYIIK